MHFKLKFLYFLTAIFLFFGIDNSQAQSKKQRNYRKKNRIISTFTTKKLPFPKGYRYTALEIGPSAFNYFGDLAPNSSLNSTDLSFTKPGFTVSIRQKLNARVFIRTDFAWGRLEGDDFVSADPTDKNAIYRYTRNLQFRNNIKELNLVGIVELFENRSWYLKRSVINPYAFGGVGVFYHDPKAKVPDTDARGNSLPEAGQWVSLQPLGTEGQYSAEVGIQPYKNIQVSIPFGLGVYMKFNNRVDLGFDIGYRYLFFDYIDDVSQNYVDKGLLTDPLAKVLSDRSMETTAVMSGTARNMEAIQGVTTPYSYTGVDGQAYTTFSGYGHGYQNDTYNIRGNADNNDIYLVTTIRLSYILGGKMNNRRKESRGIFDFR